MPMTDTVPARFADLRERSADWRLNCITHGQVTMVLLINGDWQNSLCQDCIVAELAKSAKKAVFNANGGPQPDLLRGL